LAKNPIPSGYSRPEKTFYIYLTGKAGHRHANRRETPLGGTPAT